MTQADRVHSTPPTSTPTISPGLARQQPKREGALKRIAKLRKKAADEIERLISFLDSSDPYAATELEEAVDDVGEPSLGSGDRNIDQRDWFHWTGSTWETDSEQDTSDNEPSLGSVDGPDHGGQIHWAQGSASDFEEQCEDEGVMA